MKCPRCQVPLVRLQIENVNVRQCGLCHGNLIHPDRMNRLAATTTKSVTELMNDWRSYPQIKFEDRCKCPDCRAKMEKQKKRGGVKFDHEVCEACSLIWLDAGDLEIYQLAYLVSDKGKEAQRFKEIHQNMTEEQKIELKKLIDMLPVDAPQQNTNPYRDPTYFIPEQ